MAKWPKLTWDKEPTGPLKGIKVVDMATVVLGPYATVQMADLGAEMLAIGGNAQKRLRRGLEQGVVDHRLVGVGDVGDGRRQREDYVVILHRQQIGLARVQPALGCAALALRAVPVAAGVVGDLIQAAAFAAQDMATQCRCAALGDGRHHLELRQAQVTTLGVTPGGSMGTEDVGDLQGESPLHDGVRLQGWRLRCRFGRWFACGLGGRVIQRADDPAQQVGGHGGVQGRGVQPLVPEQHLDDADIDLLLQQMGGKGMAQAVRGDALVDAGRRGGQVHGAVELARGHVVGGVQAREQPTTVPDLALGMAKPPPGTQPLQQHGAEHGVAMSAPIQI